MVWVDGRVELKLARKLPPFEPGAGIMGNLYLSGQEFDLLCALPAAELHKRRCYFGAWAVDEFLGPLAGLVLAEVEEDDPEVLARMQPPFPFVRDVTAEEAYTGARLAERGRPRSS